MKITLLACTLPFEKNRADLAAPTATIPMPARRIKRRHRLPVLWAEAEAWPLAVRPASSRVNHPPIGPARVRILAWSAAGE